jgi:glutamine amidotransferase
VNDDARRPVVVVVKTGIANTASVLAGLLRAGARAHLSDDAGEIRDATHVLLPGVGAFGAGMALLEKRGLSSVLRARVADARPTMAICLGLQLLASESEESAGVAGLSIVPGRIRRFSSSVKVPQLGWNRVVTDGRCTLLQDGYAYFANSYCMREAPLGFASATSSYDGTFVAAFEKGALLACQFHPELSGDYGIALFRRWIEHGETAC